MTICRQETIHNHLVRWSLLYFLISDLKFATISQFHLDWVSFTGAVQWDDVLTSARLLLASVRLIYKLGSWKKVKQNQHFAFWLKGYLEKEILFEPFSHTPQARFRSHYFIKDEFEKLGCVNFLKIALDFSIFRKLLWVCDFIITNGKKSRNQRLINFASSGYPYRHFSYSPDPPTRLWFSDVNSFPSRFQENWQTTNNKWYIIAEAAWQFKQLSIVYQIWSCQMCFFVPVWSCLW